MKKETGKKIIPDFLPFPVLFVAENGKVGEVNQKISEVFSYGEITGADIFALTGFRYEELCMTDKIIKLERNGKIFILLRREISGGIMLFFKDITELDVLKEKYDGEKPCICLISVDNMDELLARTAEGNQSQLISSVDKIIRQWAAAHEASVLKYSADEYYVLMLKKEVEKVIESKFSILDEIRGIETEADFPVTLSIGAGIGGINPAHADLLAAEAHNLALGRGGDQAVVKDIGSVRYYGGKTQTVEKNNKGKSRVIAHVLRPLIYNADRVFIMGHKNPDMDSFGSALGIFRLAKGLNKETHIIINAYGESLGEIFKQAKESEEYSFISSEKAMELASEESLVIILDANRPILCECEDIIGKVQKTVIIDHHRMTEDSVKNPTLSYIMLSASSTAELVTEILQYAGEKKSLKTLEAEALLAGMAIDTNRFAMKTGVRTFEAAAWLKRSGADTNSVKRFFQADKETFRIKSECLSNAEFLDGGFVVSSCSSHPDMNVINSQAADELLEIKGIRASFVLGSDESGRTLISARSLGEVNVQLVMEKFGGGGHITTAGAQVDESIEKVKEDLKAILQGLAAET